MRSITIIGGGPSGFLIAEKLIQKIQNVRINMIEAHWAPFGLLRYGVAPDHPDVKVI